MKSQVDQLRFLILKLPVPYDHCVSIPISHLLVVCGLTPVWHCVFLKVSNVYDVKMLVVTLKHQSSQSLVSSSSPGGGARDRRPEQ